MGAQILPAGVLEQVCSTLLLPHRQQGAAMTPGGIELASGEGIVDRQQPAPLQPPAHPPQAGGQGRAPFAGPSQGTPTTVGRQAQGVQLP